MKRSFSVRRIWQAFLLGVRVVFPQLDAFLPRPRLHAIQYLIVDRVGDLLVDRMHPLDVARYYARRWFFAPRDVMRTGLALAAAMEGDVESHVAGEPVIKVAGKGELLRFSHVLHCVEPGLVWPVESEGAQ